MFDKDQFTKYQLHHLPIQLLPWYNQLKLLSLWKYLFTLVLLFLSVYVKTCTCIQSLYLLIKSRSWDADSVETRVEGISGLSIWTTNSHSLLRALIFYLLSCQQVWEMKERMENSLNDWATIGANTEWKIFVFEVLTSLCVPWLRNGRLY